MTDQPITNPVRPDERQYGDHFPSQFDWVPVHDWVKERHVRVLLFLLWCEAPVVGYWDGKDWEADTEHVECNTGMWGNGGTVERNFKTEEVIYVAKIRPAPHPKDHRWVVGKGWEPI